MIILTIILVPLIALSFDHQNHSKWHKWCHVRYKLPFLVIDDNTIKASIIFAKIDKFNRLIIIQTAYTCLDAYHHPMMTWPPSKTMISPFVPPLILLLLPHDLIHLGISPPLGYASSP